MTSIAAEFHDQAKAVLEVLLDAATQGQRFLIFQHLQAELERRHGWQLAAPSSSQLLGQLVSSAAVIHSGGYGAHPSKGPELLYALRPWLETPLGARSRPSACAG